MHSHDHSHTSGKKLFLTIIFNSIITIAEFIGGLMTGYLALIADAVHNLSDVAALGLAWLGVKGSTKPATKTSTYGYKRIEVMTAFISAISLVVIAIFILIEAYSRFMNPQPLTNPVIFLTVAIIGLLGNLFSIWILHSEKGKSLNMKTAFLHMAYDTLSSVVVIIGGIVILYTDIYLIDSIPANINFDEVYRAILALPPVADVHDLHIWSLSSKDVALSCHVIVAEEYLTQAPRLTEEINTMLHQSFEICHGTIQVETEACYNAHLLCVNTIDKESHGNKKNG